MAKAVQDPALRYMVYAEPILGARQDRAKNRRSDRIMSPFSSVKDPTVMDCVFRCFTKVVTPHFWENTGHGCSFKNAV